MKVLRTKGLGLLASAILFLITFAVVVFGLFRTFDFTDEAWATGLVAEPALPFGNVFFFQFLIHPIFLFFGQSVLAIRLLRLALGIVVALILAQLTIGSLRVKYRDLDRNSKLSVHLLAQSASLLSWFWTPSVLGYNELNSAVIQISVTALFFIAHRTGLGELGDKSISVSNVVLVYVVGFIGSLLFYTKITSFLVFGLTYLLFCVLLFKKNVLVWFGAVLTFILFPLAGWAFSSQVKEYLSNFFTVALSSRLRVSAGHGDSIIFFYFADILINLLIVAIPIVFATLVLDRIRNQSKSGFSTNPFISFLVRPIVAFSLIYLAAAGWIFHPFNTAGQSVGRIVVLLLAISTVFLLVNWEGILKLFLNRDYTLLFGLLLMLCVPIMNSFGTNVILSAHIGLSATSVICLVAYLGISHSNSPNKLGGRVVPFLTPLIVLSLVALFSLGVFKSAFYPYRSESVFVPKHSVEVDGPLAGLFLSDEESAYISWLRDEGQYLNASGLPAVSLESPGALIFFNNSDFASSWIEYPVTLGFDSIAKACKGFSGKDLFLLMPSNRSIDDKNVQFLNSSLVDCNLRYPEDFVLKSHHVSNEERFRTSIYNLKN